jgi:hypothetical protein
MIKIRIGLGQTKSGKILDRNTTYFVINKRSGQNEKDRAIMQHLETKKPIFVTNGRGYREITLEQLRNL